MSDPMNILDEKKFNRAWQSLEASNKKLYIATVYTDDFCGSLFFYFRNQIIKKIKPANVISMKVEFNSQYIKEFIRESKEKGASYTVHSAMLEKLTQSMPNNSLVLIIDLDAYPLSKDALKLTFLLANNFKVSGNAQRTNCIENGEHIFAGPSYLCIDTNFVHSLDKPWDVNERSDVGEEISWELGHEINKSIFLPYKTVKRPIWPLKGTKKVYGIGTFFAYYQLPISYHHFFSRNLVAKVDFMLISMIKYLQLELNQYKLYLSRARIRNPMYYIKRSTASLKSSIKYLINRPY